MMNRKQFLKRAGQLGLAALLPAGIYAAGIEPYRLEFVRRKLPIAHLPVEMEGKILMQISDMHVCPWMDWRFLMHSFAAARAFQPDFVVYTGDFISYCSPKDLTHLQTVMQQAVLGKLGTLGILGNHDYGPHHRDISLSRKVCAILENAGVAMLNNAQKEVQGLNFIGFEDLWSPMFQPEPAMASHEATKASIVLCHNPDACDLPVWNGYQGWILSGHTHGGQCQVPYLNYAPLLPVKNKRYVCGAYDLYDGRQLYINRALGCTIPLRFHVLPEITVFTLQNAIV